MVVNRNLQVSVKKGGGMTMKTLEGMLSKVDAADGGERVGEWTLSWSISYIVDLHDVSTEECYFDEVR